MSAKKLVVSAIAISLMYGLNACQTMDEGFEKQTVTQQKPSEVGVSQVQKEPPAPKPQPKPQPQTQTQYEETPDLSQGIQLEYDEGGLSSDTVINMSTSPDQVSQDVALSDHLQPAAATNNTQTGVAQAYDSVSEGEIEGDGVELLVFDQNSQAAANMQGNVNNNLNGTYTGNYGYNNSPQGSNEFKQQYQQGNNGRCSLNLHQEASGVARVLIQELVTRLRTQPGDVFVAPTIVSQSYNECVKDLSLAIKDGLAQQNTLTVVPGTTNLNNVISQNIGSNTILPNLIHYSRAANIPYLITSQVRKTGDKAALTIRIIRTDDGITLSQTFRRLSE